MKGKTLHVPQERRRINRDTLAAKPQHKRPTNGHEKVLERAKKDNLVLRMVLTDGAPPFFMRCTDYDRYSVSGNVLMEDGSELEQVIFKHAIATFAIYNGQPVK